MDTRSSASQKPNDVVANATMTLRRKWGLSIAQSALYRASQAILAAEDPKRLPGLIVEVALTQRSRLAWARTSTSWGVPGASPKSSSTSS